MNLVKSVMRTLSQWYWQDYFNDSTPFEIVVRSSVHVRPGAVLLIDTLEITDGKVIAVAYPKDPQ